MTAIPINEKITVIRGLNLTNEELKKAEAENKMLLIDIETSNICNLNCQYCFRDVYGTKEALKNELTLKQRLELIKSIKNVTAARLGRHDNDTLKTVEEINPDIILLGPNQKYDLNTLKNGLSSKGLAYIEVKRLETYYDKYELHSSSLIKKKILELNSKT